MAEDLKRFVEDRPIQARRVGPVERLWRWARRDPVTAGLAGTIATLLLATTVGAILAAVREDRLRVGAEKSAEAEKTAAASEKAARGELERTLYFERIALIDQKLAADHRDQVEELLDQCPPEMRGWEWNYLKHRLQADPYVELRGHTSFVSSVAFHPDGRRLATGSGDSTVRIWDRTTGKQARPPLYGHFGSVMGVAISPDGRYLGSASNDKTVKIWDVASGKALHTLRGHDDAVIGVTFSPDSQLVASAARDKTVRIWEAATGRAVHTCQGHPGIVFAVAFSPDGRRVASAGTDGTVKLWDVTTGQEALSWREVSPGLPGLAFRPGGHHLAVACGRAVYIHDLADGRLEHTLRGHSMGVYPLAFSPDGRRLASGGVDNTVKLWDPDTGREILTMRGHTDMLRGVAFSPDGHHLATASNDQTIKVWDAPDRAEGAAALVRTVRLYKDRAQMFGGLAQAISPDGQRLAAGYLDGTVRLWDLGAGQETAVFRVGDFAIAVTAFSPDGSRLAATDSHGDLKVWDLSTGRELWRERDKGTQVIVAFSPGNRWLAFGDFFSADITVREAATGGPVKTLRHASVDLSWLDFSPDGRLFASCGGVSKTVKVWKTDTFQEFRTLPHPDLVFRLRFSPDSRRLATASNDKTVRLWDLETGQEVFTFRDHSRLVLGVDFSPDGRAVASAGGTETMVWNSSDGQVLRRFRGHAGLVLLARFSPDGRRLFTIGEDGTLKVWELNLTPLDWHGPAARKLVDERFAKLLLRADVVESLRADKAIPAEVLPVALQLAEEHDEDPKLIDAASVAVVKERGGDPAAYRLALRRAEAACRIWPDNGMYLNTVGLAHYRLGQYREAEVALRQCEPLNTLRFDGPWPRDLALRALLQLQEGRRDEARATANQLREVMKTPRWANAPVSTIMQREVEELLAQKDGDGPEKPKP
jgi:WD40 repeat protein